MAKEETRNTPEERYGGLRLSRLRPTRRRALEVGLMGVILIVAVFLRVLPIQWGTYYTAYDPLFQYRATEYIVENGFSSWFTWHDDLSWYPMGRNVPNSAYPGVPFSAAFVYHLVNLFGLRVSVHDVGLFFPILMACLTCIAAYYLGKELNGKATGYCAAFFMAISPAFIGRTHMGFFDTENIGIFGMVATSLLFLRSINWDNNLGHRVMYAIAAGLSFGYVFASWGAARYILGLITLFMVVTLVRGKYETRHLMSYAFTIGVGYLIAALVPRLGLRYLMSVENLMAFGFTLLLLAYGVLKNRIDPRTIRLGVLGITLVMLIGAFTLPALGFGNRLENKFINVINPLRILANPLFESVAEHKFSSWTSFFNDFGMIMVFGIMGAYFAMQRLDDKNLYALLFLLTGVYFAGSMSRLNLILSVPVSLMGAIGLTGVMKSFVVITAQREPDRRRRRRGPVLGVSRELGVIFTILILLATLPSIWNAAGVAARPNSLASSGIPVMFGNDYPKDWMQALEWMRDNLTDDSVVCSWWDYGYWIEAIAGRRTMADGATMHQNQIANIGNIMMRPLNESLPRLEKYGATHIVVFKTFNPNNPQQEWPFGDNVKWRWMVQIGRLNISDYITYTSQGAYPSARYTNSTLYRLMNMEANPEHFELVFASEYTYVLVYEIKY